MACSSFFMPLPQTASCRPGRYVMESVCAFGQVYKYDLLETSGQWRELLLFYQSGGEDVLMVKDER